MRKNKWRIVGPAAAVTVVVGAALYFHAASGSGDAPAASGAISSAMALLGSASAGLPPLPGDPGANAQAAAQVMSRATLTDAIAFAKPFMADTQDKLDEGSALLTLWSARHLTWAALNALPETSPALFQKDPDAERGKRMCVSGTIVEIRAERTLAQRMINDQPEPLIAPPEQNTPPSGIGFGVDDAGVTADAGSTLLPIGTSADDWKIPGGGKVFFAMVTTAKKEKPTPGGDQTTAPIVAPPPPDQPPPLVAASIDVKNSDDLVDGSAARVCGVLTGVTRHSTSDGSTILAHRLIGMFDLPDNRGGAPAAPARPKSARPGAAG